MIWYMIYDDDSEWDLILYYKVIINIILYSQQSKCSIEWAGEREAKSEEREVECSAYVYTFSK